MSAPMCSLLFLILSLSFAAEDEEETNDSILIEEEATVLERLGSHTQKKIDEGTAQNADIGDLLQQVPSTFIRRLGGLGSFSTVSIRGSSARQSTIYLEGIPLNPEGLSAINLSELPLHAFGQVDVYRSHPPLSFQSGSIGGAINLITQKKKGASVIGSVGSLGTQRIRGFIASPNTVFFADGFHSLANYRFFDNNSTVFNDEDDLYKTRSNNDKWQGNALAVHQKDDWSILHNSMFREEGLPGSIDMTTHHVRMRTQNHLSSITWQNYGAPFEQQVSAWHLFREETLDDRSAEIYGAELWNRWSFQNIGFKGFFQWNDQNLWPPSIGITFRRDSAKQVHLINNRPSSSFERYVGIVQVGKQRLFLKNRLLLTGASQGYLLVHQHQNAWLPKWTVTGRASLQYTSNSWALWSAIQNGFRPPDLTELFGNRGMQKGNPDLRPEYAVTWDTGISWAFRDLQVQSAYFGRIAKDDIILVQNAQKQSIPINFSSTQTQGVELALLWNPQEWLNWNISGTFTHSENNSSLESLAGNQLPNVPKWMVQNHMQIRNKVMSLTYNTFFVAGNPWDATNVYWSPQRLIHNAHLNISSAHPWPSLSLEMRNIANTITEQVPTDPLQPELGLRTQAVSDFIGYPIAGRVWLCTLSWKIP